MIGPLQYSRLISAMAFYEKLGFRAVEAPWAVSKEAMDITRPEWAGPTTMSYSAGGQELFPVASAEQSFLQMQMNHTDAGLPPMEGGYVALTPCFRNEPVVDELHKPWFMKVELIIFHTKPTDFMNYLSDLDTVVYLARQFFTDVAKMDVRAIPNPLPDPIGFPESARDIVSANRQIELGSYGIRQHPRIGTWIYGTGCAEPRLTFAIEND